MTLLIGTLLVLLGLIVYAAMRVHRIASWHSLLTVAIATGSARSCLDLIRFCGQSRSAGSKADETTSSRH